MKAIDTGLLIWGMRRYVQTGREDMVARCVAFLQDCKSRREVVMLPSVVLAEYLCGLPREVQIIHRDSLQRNYFIAPFDARCADIAAELYDKDNLDALRVLGTGKQCLKADLQIIATAIAHGATAIYTDNRSDFQTLGRGRILIEDIPELPPRQLELLTGDEPQ